MTDAPHDADSLIAWFTATEIVRHNGSRSLREPYMTQTQAKFLAAKIGQPNFYRKEIEWQAEIVWKTALRHGLFMARNFGWIDREGDFWGCGHAGHDMLLHFLNKSAAQVEDAGWIHIGVTGAQCFYAPSDGQFLTLLRLGHEGTAKNRLTECVSQPTRSAIRAARVILP